MIKWSLLALAWREKGGFRYNPTKNSNKKRIAIIFQNIIKHLHHIKSVNFSLHIFIFAGNNRFLVVKIGIFAP